MSSICPHSNVGVIHSFNGNIPYHQCYLFNAFFMKLFAFPALLLLLCSNINAQQLDFLPGEIIVQFEERVDPHSLLLNSRSSTASFKIEEINPIKGMPMNVHVIKVDPNKVNLRDAISKLMSSKGVIHAQTNKIMQLRLIPNDTLFNRQWQYINTGEGGGVEDADLDIELAWDISTGGVTPDGDTIVVCVVDDGYDTDHEDMVDNLWVNHDEIPGDTIDNDNNGYVDDIHGWNLMGDNNDIGINGGHGTPVAGIIGAKGNNEVGVAGVNWDVKLMIMKQKNSLSESNVLESYAYAYNKRKEYNESNGEKGAFVVSINSSWGRDMGNPDDAPIWCDFYNIMGEEGILNCGATANRNFDIDEVGDLPTGCSSDYLISVTNMNRSDIKVTGAGYGRVTIDLGAFGSQAYTAASGNSYSGFGGTSGATPHVAGAIALMYSAPCSELSALAKENPGLAALAVKEMILNNVDELDNLDGITTARGRLNVAKAMQAVETLCDSLGGTFGFGIESEIFDNTIQWSNNKMGLRTDLRIRHFDSTEWIEHLDIQSGFNIPDLDLCAMYEYQTRSYDPANEIPYGFSRFIETDGCCAASEITDIEVTETSLTISFDNPEEVVNLLEYRLYGDTEWDSIVGEEEILLDGFPPCSLIEYRVSTQCPQFNNSSDVSNIQYLSSVCGNCTETEYCEIDSYNNNDEWIESITIGDETFVSGQGYSPFNMYTGGFIPVLNLGEKYPIRLEPGFGGTSYSEYFQIYIDLDQDGTFNEEEELIFDAGDSSSNPVEDTISVPLTSSLGLTRMRVIMTFDVPTMSCGASNSAFGEIEDYCVELSPNVSTNDPNRYPFELVAMPSIFDQELCIKTSYGLSGLLNVYNINGQKIYEQPIESRFFNKAMVNTEAWKSGVYIVQLTSGKVQRTIKVVKP